jgi:hypothetical protein
MSFLKRLFGGRMAGSSESTGVSFSRYSPQPAHSATGQERQTYIQRVAEILGRSSAELELDAPLISQYGCDEMEVSECVQIAEEIWSVALMPNPMQMSDYADIVKRFATLTEIIGEAERKSKKSS